MRQGAAAVSQAPDLLDPFPSSPAARAVEIRRRLELAHAANAPKRREKYLREVLTRVVQGRQTFDDVATLAVELGIPLTIRPTHNQD